MKIQNLKDKDLMFIKDAEGWLDKANEKCVIQFHGKCDDDELSDYYMYDIYSETPIDFSELKKLIKEDIHLSDEL